MDRIVKEMLLEKPSPVIAYKHHGKHDKYRLLDESTFMIALMTEFQAEIFQTFSERIVCVDATHNTNQYGFHLISVLVADEYRNGEKLSVYWCTLLNIEIFVRVSHSMGNYKQGG